MQRCENGCADNKEVFCSVEEVDFNDEGAGYDDEDMRFSSEGAGAGGEETASAHATVGRPTF